MEPCDRSAVHRPRVAVRTDASRVRLSTVRGGIDRGSDAAETAAEEGDRRCGGGSHGDGRREAGSRGAERGVSAEEGAVPDVFADEWEDEGERKDTDKSEASRGGGG